MGSAYGVIRSAAWDIFVDEGALVYDSVANHFTMDVVKMTNAIRKLLITIEGEGDEVGDTEKGIDEAVGRLLIDLIGRAHLTDSASCVHDGHTV